MRAQFPWSDHFVFCAKSFCGCKEMISGVFKPNPKPFPVGKAWGGVRANKTKLAIYTECAAGTCLQ
jgi:hypothetical protein